MMLPQLPDGLIKTHRNKLPFVRIDLDAYDFRWCAMFRTKETTRRNVDFQMTVHPYGSG